jgi:hypothetical protein
MHAVPIHTSAIVQTAPRTATGVKRAVTMAAFGSHHASALVRAFASQSREVDSVVGHDGSQERPACIGGHGTEPKEQNTQQSPGFGRRVTPQPLHS